jgi:hypothetical protein
MNIRSAICCLLVFWISLSVPSTFRANQGATSGAQDSDIAVQELLVDLGKKNGVVFTVEEAVLDEGDPARIRFFRMHERPKGEDLKTALDEMARSAPTFTWYRDGQNARIIHIIDNALLSRKNYSMDRIVDTVDFTGTVSGLVDALAAKGVPVSSLGSFDSSEFMFTDFRSLVSVRAKDAAVRDLLTDYVSLEGRGAILWVSETRLSGPDLKTYVRYRGAPPRNAEASSKQSKETN